MRRLLLATRLLLLVALVAAVGAYAKTPSGQFTVTLPAPGHMEVVVVQTKAGSHYAKGAVPRPTVANLPSGFVVAVSVGRLKKNHGLLDAGVVVVNLNKQSASRHAAAAGGGLTIALKWTPLRYTNPGAVTSDDCSGDKNQISCTGTDPGKLHFLGWDQTELDGYSSFFASPASGQTATDLGWDGGGTSGDKGYSETVAALVVLFAPSGNTFVATTSNPAATDLQVAFSLFAAIKA